MSSVVYYPLTITSNRAYQRGLLAWLAVYGVLLVASINLIRHGLPQPLVVPITLSPMIAAFGILHVVMERYRSMDELEQRILSESILFAFGWSAILTFSYGFLENSAGAPQLSYFWVWTVMGAGWLVGSVLARRRYQ